MNRIIFIIIIFLSVNSFSQGKLKIKYFESTIDYVSNKLSDEFVLPKRIKRISKKLVRIKKLLDSKTGKKSKKAGIPWAIDSFSGIYFNLFYCNDMFSPGLYLNPDVIGRYCVFYAKKESLRLIHSYSPNYNGGGLTGIFINESKKWGKNWIGENEEKIKIFIVDTKKLELKRKNKNYAIWKIMGRKNINDILDLNLTEDKLKKISLEEVKKIIIEKNNAG